MYLKARWTKHYFFYSFVLIDTHFDIKLSHKLVHWLFTRCRTRFFPCMDSICHLQQIPKVVCLLSGFPWCNFWYHWVPWTPEKYCQILNNSKHFSLFRIKTCKKYCQFYISTNVSVITDWKLFCFALFIINLKFKFLLFAMAIYFERKN